MVAEAASVYTGQENDMVIFSNLRLQKGEINGWFFRIESKTRYVRVLQN